ncbi:MAG: thioredoxin fold domain-containing protein [Neisseriaceae bacterium]|nr:MAG: thioredoxin fold domain-containing protein [Neisseriaceae bacterium]
MKKTNTFTRVSLVGLLILLGTIGCTVPIDRDLSQAKDKMNKFLAGYGLTIKSSKYKDTLGLYEFVVNGNKIIYLDEKMNNVLIGDVININTKENYTDQRLNQLEVIDFNKLPLDQAVKVVQGNGQVAIAVFTDPDCPFCKKLEQDLKKVDNITIYNFLYPIDSLHPNAKKKSTQIWCQGNKRSQVWVDYMRDNKAIPKVSECSNPIQKNLKLGDDVGIYGTPVIFLPDGKRIGGYIPYGEFTKIINQYRKK